MKFIIGDREILCRVWADFNVSVCPTQSFLAQYSLAGSVEVGRGWLRRDRSRRNGIRRGGVCRQGGFGTHPGNLIKEKITGPATSYATRKNR